MFLQTLNLCFASSILEIVVYLLDLFKIHLNKILMQAWIRNQKQNGFHLSLSNYLFRVECLNIR